MAQTSHLVWQVQRISLAERELRNHHKAAILWLTGLPASGKTTLAFQLEESLFAKGAQTCSLDGDNVRHGLCRDLGFSARERRENIRRVGEVAALFMQSGQIVLSAFISPYQQDREQVRRLVEPGRFIEIFVDCPLAECERRDPKGHYRMARAGTLPEFTGISAPYEAPTNPELHIQTEHCTVAENVTQIIDYLYAHDILHNKNATGLE